MKLSVLRQRTFAREVAEVVALTLECTEAMDGTVVDMTDDKIRNNTLGELNDVLFEQLRALRAVDATDRDTLDAEIARSKATETLSKAIIANAETVLEATRMRADFTNKVAEVPRMLGGE